MKLNRVLQLLGLAARAGQVTTGTEAVKNSILRKKAYLLILSTDIADNSHQELKAACLRSGVRWIYCGDKNELGQAVGKPYRVAVAVNEPRLAQRIISELDAGESPSTNMGVDK
ncbi:MAG: L7Ae/L30e/S12e/Gadd45 family ribosomal protein [Methylocystaceae bacterium]